MRLLPLLLALGVACGSDPTTPAGFDHEAIFEVRDRAISHADVPFRMEVPTLFRTQDDLPNLDVRALAIHGGEIFAGTAGGLMKTTPQGAVFLPVNGADAPIVDLAVRGAELIAAARDRVYVVGASGVESWPASTSSITSIAVVGSEVWVGASDGLFTAGASGTASVAAIAVRDLAVSGDVLFLAGDGVARFSTTERRFLDPIAIDDPDVRALASGGGGEVLAACASGLARIRDGSAEIQRAASNGLPAEDLTAVFASGGTVIVGHGIGATVIGEKLEHYHSLRWIPDERVTAVALDDDGTRWIGTPAGVSRIAYEEWTLAEKAEFDEQLLQERHWRMDGFVDDDVTYDDPWDLTRGLHTGDHDNDGLWTEMQIGAWCYAYAVTGEERFYQSARRAMDVMMLQIEIPGLTFEAAGKKKGFITRSLVRDDEGAVFEDKKTRPNWHLQEYEGRQYYWKDDTSSDEYAGHFFGVPLYYDLCAKTEEEKEELRNWVRLAMDYVIEGGYVLLDLDGERTTHGYWQNLGVAWNGLDACTEKYGPEFIDECVGSRHGQGWLNSAEILGHLLATWHMTGDQKYYDEYERLAIDEHYLDMIEVIDDTFTVTRPSIANHSDHELAMLAHITLLRYEPNVERREQYVQSLLDFYEHEREEHNPWQIGVIGGVWAEDVDLSGAIRTLEDMPNDWRQWRYDNSHRMDSKRNGNDRHGNPQFARVFPYDEIRTMKWNGSPYAVVGGGTGNGVLAPTPYLIAYWTLRYHNLITGGGG
jgi:hypothetical protein